MEGWALVESSSSLLKSETGRTKRGKRGRLSPGVIGKGAHLCALTKKRAPEGVTWYGKN